MSKKITTLILSNLPLKILSLICGYGVWSMMSQSHIITVTHQVPVCVYNAQANKEVRVPETIEVTLQATRSTLYSLDAQELGIHIDASRLHNGDNQLLVDRTTLFLPDKVNVVHYSPSNATILVTEKI
jgi:YbbR domain-containing protein